MSSEKFDLIKDRLATIDYIMVVAVLMTVFVIYISLKDDFSTEDDLQSDKFNCLDVYFGSPVPHSNPMQVRITTLSDNEAGIFSTREGIYKVVRDNATFDYDESDIESVRILPNDCR